MARLKWQRRSNGDWETSDGYGTLILQHSRKSKKWYLMRGAWFGNPTVLSDHASRQAGQAEAERIRGDK